MIHFVFLIAWIDATYICCTYTRSARRVHQPSTYVACLWQLRHFLLFSLGMSTGGSYTCVMHVSTHTNIYFGYTATPPLVITTRREGGEVKRETLFSECCLETYLIAVNRRLKLLVVNRLW